MIFDIKIKYPSYRFWGAVPLDPLLQKSMTIIYLDPLSDNPRYAPVPITLLRYNWLKFYYVASYYILVVGMDTWVDPRIYHCFKYCNAGSTNFWPPNITLSCL